MRFRPSGSKLQRCLFGGCESKSTEKWCAKINKIPSFVWRSFTGAMRETIFTTIAWTKIAESKAALCRPRFTDLCYFACNVYFTRARWKKKCLEPDVFEAGHVFEQEERIRCKTTHKYSIGMENNQFEESVTVYPWLQRHSPNRSLAHPVTFISRSKNKW